MTARTALPPGIERHGKRFRVVKKVHGRLIRKSFASLEGAISYLADLQVHIVSERQQRENRPSRALTVGDLVDRWFASHRKRLQPGTEFDYEQRIRREVTRPAPRTLSI